MDLHHARDKRLRTGPDDPDGKFPPGEKCLDEDRLVEGFQNRTADMFKLRPVGDLRGGGHPFSRPFGDRFGEKRKRQRHAGDLLRRFDDGEIRSRYPEVADHPLRHPLVERER